MNELQRFLAAFDFEAPRTAKLLESLPQDQQDFRPDPQGRSLADLAWHLAEVEAVMSFAAEQGRLDLANRPPDLPRPATMALFPREYLRVHQEARTRLERLGDVDPGRMTPFFGREIALRDLLWKATLHHLLHHRGQLTLMCRLAGGTPPGLYGPNREGMATMRAQR